ARGVLGTDLRAVGLFVICIVTRTLPGATDYRTLRALVDPFGQLAMATDAAFWSNAEFNSRMLQLDGLLLWNRVIWIGIGAVLLALSFTLFATRERRPPARRLELRRGAAGAAEAPSPSPRRPCALRQWREEPPPRNRLDPAELDVLRIAAARHCCLRRGADHRGPPRGLSTVATHLCHAR